LNARYKDRRFSSTIAAILEQIMCVILRKETVCRRFEVSVTRSSFGEALSWQS